jgi:hypothetical protein
VSLTSLSTSSTSCSADEHHLSRHYVIFVELY